MITLEKNRNSRSYSRNSGMVKHIKISDDNWESLRKLDGGSFNDKITKLLGKEINPKIVRRLRSDASKRIPNEVIDAYIFHNVIRERLRRDLVMVVGEKLEKAGWLELYKEGYPDKDWTAYRSRLSVHIDNRIKALMQYRVMGSTTIDKKNYYQRNQIEYKIHDGRSTSPDDETKEAFIAYSRACATVAQAEHCPPVDRLTWDDHQAEIWSEYLGTTYSRIENGQPIKSSIQIFKEKSEKWNNWGIKLAPRASK